MAFVKATIQIVSALVGTGIKVSLRKGKKSGAKMSIGISSTAIKQLSFADGDKVEVLIGDGEHHGLLRIRKNNSAGEAKVEKRETAKGSWFQVQLGNQPAFIDRSEPARWCQWEKVEDGWIEIVMPKWADETAPRKVQASSVTSASSLVRPGPQPQPTGGRNVTAAIMGDPPAGRREMLEKIGKVKA